MLVQYRHSGTLVKYSGNPPKIQVSTYQQRSNLIRKSFKEYIPETTKLIIAQRIASIQDADKIVILDGGMISAMGTHEQLLKDNEIYQELYYSQNKAGNDNG